MSICHSSENPNQTYTCYRCDQTYYWRWDPENNNCYNVQSAIGPNTYTSLDRCLNQCSNEVYRRNLLSAGNVNCLPYVKGTDLPTNPQQACYRCVEGSGCMPVPNSFPCSMCGTTCPNRPMHTTGGSSDQCCYCDDTGCIGAGSQVQTFSSCYSTCKVQPPPTPGNSVPMRGYLNHEPAYL